MPGSRWWGGVSMGQEGLGDNGRHGREIQADVQVGFWFKWPSSFELEAEGMDNQVCQL